MLISSESESHCVFEGESFAPDLLASVADSDVITGVGHQALLWGEFLNHFCLPSSQCLS